MEATEILDNITSTKRDICEYITSTEHWLFYWISVPEVREFIEAFPEDYEAFVNISVEEINEVSQSIKISFYDHPDEVEFIKRNVILSTFRDTVKVNWKNWKGEVKDLLIKEKEEAIEYYKERIDEIEQELKKLKETKQDGDK